VATRSNCNGYLGKRRSPRGGRFNKQSYNRYLTPGPDWSTSGLQFNHHRTMQDRGMGNDGRFAGYTILMKTVVRMLMSSQRKCSERSKAHNKPQGNQPTKYLRHAPFHRLLCLGPHRVICQGSQEQNDGNREIRPTADVEGPPILSFEARLLTRQVRSPWSHSVLLLGHNWIEFRRSYGARATSESSW
jgi:hypothetical protein